MLNGILLTVEFYMQNFLLSYAEYRHAECIYSDCSYAECRGAL